ncbi:hemK methyltransferase family member 2 [Ceratina calcarata]|uniref:Methyltransferase HEMK2 n=1 Tax=Ceratina calcarata TaxID=156304 RepID=A0AAJ7J2P1_9HYME|nr:hemK methyltransferase family member 2 [Ceratina calcarata]
MDTPIVKLSDKDLESVYEPSEDSFLLIDALENDLEVLKSLRPVMCLEIGSGSGVVITALAMALRNHCQPCHLAIDINFHACEISKRTAIQNSVDLDTVQMDLLSCIRDDCIFDVIVFNPPYVVTNDDEISNGDVLFKAWAGGANGRKVMERVFLTIPNILSDLGVFYMLVIKENDPEYILRVFRSLNMIGEIVIERRIRGEHLYILRFRKAK